MKNPNLIEFTRESFLEKWEEKFFLPKAESNLLYQIDLPKNWYGLVDRLCTAIFAYQVQCPKMQTVVIYQVKEKFGKLRFYYEGGDDVVRGLVLMAEVLSEDLSRISMDESH